jgi:hypothetical protein
MESPKWKRISDVEAGVLMIDQVKPAVLEGTEPPLILWTRKLKVKKEKP